MPPPIAQLGVTDAAVVHRDGSPTRDAPNASTYQAMASRALPTDRYGSAAGRGTAARRFGYGFVEFCDGGIGATHDNSFRSIGLGFKKIRGGFQACPQAGRERRIRLDRKLVAMQHGQRIVAVVHDFPPSGSG